MRLKPHHVSESGLEATQPDQGLALEASRQEPSPALTQSPPPQALQDQAHSQLATRLQRHFSADDIARITYAAAQVAHQESHKGQPECFCFGKDGNSLAIKYPHHITELRIADLLQQARASNLPQHALQGTGPWSAHGYQNGMDVQETIAKQAADLLWRQQEAEAYDRGEYVPGGGLVENELPGIQMAPMSQRESYGSATYMGKGIKLGAGDAQRYFGYESQANDAYGLESDDRLPTQGMRLNANIPTQAQSPSWLGMAQGVAGLAIPSLQNQYTYGLAETAYAGARNTLARVVGGVGSWGVLAKDGLADAVQFQDDVNENLGYVPQSPGARSMGYAIAPTVQQVSDWGLRQRGTLEQTFGDGPTSFTLAAGQFGLETLGLVTGVRGAVGALDGFVGIKWGAGVASTGLYSRQAGGLILPQIRFVGDIRSDILSALPEGASLVQTTRGGAAIVRFGDDAYYNIPMQSNTAAYSKLLNDVRKMDSMGEVFTDAAQRARDGYRFSSLSETWQSTIKNAPFPWLANKWESAARGTFVHERVAFDLAAGRIPGGQAFEYMRTGPDLVPRSGIGLKYEITQHTPSLNAIVAHSRRYPGELMRYVNYK